MDRSAQLEEIDSLKNIYYSEEFQVLENSDDSDNIQAIFWAFVTLPDNYEVKYRESLSTQESSCLQVKHLPPIELRITLPKDYPSESPPEFLIGCKWLPKSKISVLCKKLDDIWRECGPAEILYSWCDFLKNDSLSFLGCDKQLDLTYLCLKHLSFKEKLKKAKEETPENGNSLAELSANVGSVKGMKENHNKNRQRHPFGRSRYKMRNKNLNPKKGKSRFDGRTVLDLSLEMSPLKVLENYNTERERVEFLRSFFTCNICFSDKMGKDCIQFKDCKHVFCRNCISSYFTIRIKDGTIQSIKCPEDKCTAEALPSQIKDNVSEELFARYDSLLLSTALDTLNDIIYCPRQICQYPVSWDPEEKMASCPNCHYVFCVTCKMVYHGVEPCQFKSGEVQKLMEEYENGSAEVRQQMEVRYGKRRLECLMNNMKADAWIKENSKTCPNCEAAIEKSGGCNKMLCLKCNATFCWLCSELVDPKNPYLHFRDPQSRCANKLFYLVHETEEEDQEEEDDDDDEEEDSEDDISDWEEEYLAMVEDDFYYV